MDTFFQSMTIPASRSTRSVLPVMGVPAMVPTVIFCSVRYRCNASSCSYSLRFHSALLKASSSHKCIAVPTVVTHGMPASCCSHPARRAARQWSHGVPISLGPIVFCKDRGWCVIACTITCSASACACSGVIPVGWLHEGRRPVMGVLLI